MLAVKLMLSQEVKIEVVNFATPFCLCNRCSLGKFAEELKLNVHRIVLGEEFLSIVADPPHGYGSQMNPCIDCRILMLKRAKELAEKIGASFIVTGEVLDERPFSQRKEAMLHIEKEAGLEGKILRPLSANLLPKSQPEIEGLVDKEHLLAIRGRRRLPQMESARNLGLRDYPCPSGGCLLTDPRFADRLREHLAHEKTLTVADVALLKIGRHFRVGATKTIVGRNEVENERLTVIAENRGDPQLFATHYNGPTTLLIGENKPCIVEEAAAITVRYSDAPNNVLVEVTYRGLEERIIKVKAMNDQELKPFRI